MLPYKNGRVNEIRKAAIINKVDVDVQIRQLNVRLLQSSLIFFIFFEL
jgi:hypothetical protein